MGSHIRHITILLLLVMKQLALQVALALPCMSRHMVKAALATAACLSMVTAPAVLIASQPT
jgi:hypothetical protein